MRNSFQVSVVVVGDGVCDEVCGCVWWVGCAAGAVVVVVVVLLLPDEVEAARVMVDS